MLGTPGPLLAPNWLKIPKLVPAATPSGSSGEPLPCSHWRCCHTKKRSSHVDGLLADLFPVRTWLSPLAGDKNGEHHCYLVLEFSADLRWPDCSVFSGRSRPVAHPLPQQHWPLA